MFGIIQNIRLFLYSGSVLRVSHLLPRLFREIFASTEPLYIFEFKFEYEKKTVSSFAKLENPEIKSFCIALHLILVVCLHCVCTRH
jgi:hypothetical protein